MQDGPAYRTDLHITQVVTWVICRSVLYTAKNVYMHYMQDPRGYTQDIKLTNPKRNPNRLTLTLVCSLLLSLLLLLILMTFI